MPVVDEKERLQQLHLTLEAALEQLGYAQQAAAQGGDIGHPAPEALRIDKLLGELVELRNEIRTRLMGLLGKPTLTILK